MDRSRKPPAPTTGQPRDAGGDWTSALHFGLLRTFIAVADLKSVTQAARTLRVAQSAVSTQMATLARITGLTLTERRGGEMILTPAGRNLYDAAQRVVQQIVSLRESVAREQGNESLPLTAVGPRFACNSLVPKFVLPFLLENPHVRFQAHCTLPRETTSYIATGDVDLAFAEEAPSWSPFTFRPLLNDRFCLILPPQAPLASSPVVEPSDLMQLKFMMFPAGRRMRSIIEERLGAVASRLNVIGEIDSIFAIIHSVEAGFCAGFVPESMLTYAKARGALIARQVEGVDFSRNLGIVIDPDRAASLGLECFLDWIDRRHRIDDQAASSTA